MCSLILSVCDLAILCSNIFRGYLGQILTQQIYNAATYDMYSLSYYLKIMSGELNLQPTPKNNIYTHVYKYQNRSTNSKLN